jgi:hypothetical protein
MTLEAIVTELRAAGVCLTIEGGKVKATGDKAALERWLPVLREHKADLLAYLWAEVLREHYEERAAILEYEGGLPRAEAEANARASTGLLARNLGLPWAALRLAFNDLTLPDSPDPVDRPPYGLPAWCITPDDRKPCQQGDYRHERYTSRRPRPESAHSKPD